MITKNTTLTENGLEVSPIIAGAMRWGSWGHNLSTKGFQEAIENFMAIGINTFDHADIYGHYSTEADFGRALPYFERSQLKIITKVGIQMVSPNRPQTRLGHYELNYDYILRQTENCLKNLQSEYIDLLLVHRPSIFMEYEEIGRAFATLLEAGKVLHVGVSNFTPFQFDNLNKYVPLVTNQVEASLFHLDPFYDGTLDHAILHAYKPLIWSPLKADIYFDKKQVSEQKSRIQEISAKLANKYDVTDDLIHLRWLMEHPSQSVPIIGTCNPERIKKLEKLTGFTLELQEKFEILAAAQGHPVP